MAANASLLVELLTEELPPKALRTLGYAFADALVASLRGDGFAPANGEFTVYASPRRLGALVRDVAAKAPDRDVVAKGPSVKAGLAADGTPTQALAGFAKKQGVSVDRLERVSDGKQEVFAVRSVAAGAPLDEVLAAKVEAALEKLPIPKTMRWGDFDAEFVRPARGLVLLHGERVVPGKVLGLESGRITRGHRFLGKGEIVLARADDYERALEHEGKVIANFELRARAIRERLAQAAGAATIAAGDALFDEVTALVEWPAVYEGHFEKAFLEVPQECLMLTMRQNQKYFPLVDGQGRLSNRFLIVSNMQVAHPHHIVHGNERVLRARLADAKFFYDQDRRRTLASRVDGLAAVVYHNRLGTQLARVERIDRLAALIARKLGAEEALASRAARLCKADLLTGMVGEFPELQGVMGRYYARHDGEADAVAEAIEAHYRPRFAGDALPEGRIGDCVALADKLDTLAGIWSVGGAPTGEKDPFALRRAALGLARILVEHRLSLDVVELLQDAFAAFAPGGPHTAAAEVHAFVLDRLRSYLREQGYAPDEIESVLAEMPRRLDLVTPRIEAVRAFRALPEAESLAAANKRVRNILRKAEFEAGEPDAARCTEPAEKALVVALADVTVDVRKLAAAGDYTGSLRALARVRAQVDRFFDDVLVNVEDPAQRTNRLRLLSKLEGALNQVADISKLAS
ncbi:MAG TPA: glycine--tRNA ligase subunit beta [Burkholderiales bacterium]|nr:glycine--tRNA ligase subunit beta [Burkholderiales bacterium]